MSVNKITFDAPSLPSFSSANDLYVQAVDNSREDTKHMTGVLDNAIKSVRDNALAKMQRVVNSTTLEDFSNPEVMQTKQAEIEGIAGYYGIDTPKEAYNAMDLRKNILVERKNNEEALAQSILKTKNDSIVYERTKDVRELETNLPVLSSLNKTQGDLQFELTQLSQDLNKEGADVNSTDYINTLNRFNTVAAELDQITKNQSDILNNMSPHNVAIIPTALEQFNLGQEEKTVNSRKNIAVGTDAILSSNITRAYNIMQPFVAKFTDAKGNVDYTKLFNDPDFIKAMSIYKNDPIIMGGVLDRMNKDKQAADAEKFRQEIARRQIEATENRVKIEQQSVNQEGVKIVAGIEKDKKDRQEINNKKVNEPFQKKAANTPFAGAVTANADNTFTINIPQLAANINSALTNASLLKEPEYDYESVDAWWNTNKNARFGITEHSILGVISYDSTEVQKAIKGTLNSFVPSDKKVLSKNMKIAMLEKLKATKNNDSTYIYTSTEDAYGGTGFLKKNNEINWEAVYQAVKKDMTDEAYTRLNALSRDIYTFAEREHIDLTQVKDHDLLKNTVQKYGGKLDSRFLDAVRTKK